MAQHWLNIKLSGKTRKKAGMILSGCTDRKNTNPLIYINLWKQACLPTLLFGSELWILSQTQVLQLERCQRWFLRKVFHLPKFCDSIILTKISRLWSVESAVNYRKLLFFARTMNRSPEDNVYQLLLLRIDNFLNHPDRSTGFVRDLQRLQRFAKSTICFFCSSVGPRKIML